MTTFTELQLKAFNRFVKVQRGGRYNMLSPQARQAASLSEKEHVFILENYEAFEKAVQEAKA